MSCLWMVGHRLCADFLPPSSVYFTFVFVFVFIGVTTTDWGHLWL